ncbi:MAG: response regulator transcription factor [Eubacteriales bacterium]
MIYCVEDDAGIRNMMVYTLNASQIEAEGFLDGAALEEGLSRRLPDLIMLDIMLPETDGLTLLARLKENPATSHIPVIMATAKGEEFDKVIGLDGGADDYLTKPFGMMEMVSRVKAVLRRTTPKETPSALTYREITLDTSAHSITVSGVLVELSLKEFLILETLLKDKGMAFTRDQLLNSVWGMDYDGETRTVDVHIRSLRQKLGDCGKYIQTVRGIGYRMEGLS